MISDRIPPHIFIRNEANTGWVNARDEITKDIVRLEHALKLIARDEPPFETNEYALSLQKIARDALGG